MSDAAPDLGIEGLHRPTIEMLDRLGRLDLPDPPGGPRWVPTRLIIQNYWLYQYQEFHFADGRLVLRGQNGAGKSTVLTTAVTLCLDGDKAPSRMDTFGSNAKTIADYLVGPKEAKEGDPTYYADRTGYVAMEFRRGNEDVYRTIGLGVRAERRSNTGQPKPTSWYFVIRDGRRVGPRHEISFSRRDGGTTVMLSQRELDEVLGPQNFVSDSQSDYQHEVNQTLFGFSDDDSLRYLIQILLSVRSPKLNKDIKPEEACEILSDALPPLNPALLDKVTRLMDDIDATQAAVRETVDHLQRVEEIDEAQVAVFRNHAHAHALDFLQAEDTREGAERQLTDAMAEESRLEGVLQATNAAITKLTEEKSEVAASLQFVRRHEAFRGQEDLKEASDEAHRAKQDHDQATRAVDVQEEAVGNADAAAEDARRSWETGRGTLRGHARDLVEGAEAAHWGQGRMAAANLDDALARATPATAAPRFDAAALIDAGEDRSRRLTQVSKAQQRAEQKRRDYDIAQGRVGDRLDDLKRADEHRVQAETQVRIARADAVTWLHMWEDGLEHLCVERRLIEETAEAIEHHRRLDGDVLGVVDPIKAAARTQRNAIETERADRSAAATQQRKELRQVAVEIESLRSNRKLNEPAPRPGQVDLRARLAERGITAVPLYAACDVRDPDDLALGAQIESALIEAGLIDALIVDPTRVPEIEEILSNTPTDVSDRWLAPAPVDGPTLADVLEPVQCAVPSDLIARTLRTIALDADGGTTGARVGTDGRWRIGPISGRALDPATKQPEYIGETNRRLAWERKLRVLEERAHTIESQIAEVEEEIERFAAKSAAIEADLDLLTESSVWPDFRSALVQADLQAKAVDSAQRTLKEAEETAASAREVVAQATRAVHVLLAEIPEAKGLDLHGLETAIRRTGECIRTIQRIHPALGHLASSAAHIARSETQSKRARAMLDGMKRQAERARLTVIEKSRILSDIRERLDGLGLEDLLERARSLEEREKAIPEETSRLMERRGSVNTALKQQSEAVSAADERLEAAAATVMQAGESLGRALGLYPTLTDERERFETESPAAAARSLLKDRREDDFAAMRNRIEDDARRAYNALNKAYIDHQPALIAYSPEIEFGGEVERFVFRRVPNETGPLAPAELRAVLDRRRQLNEITVREKEDELYEAFLFGEVASEIRRVIEEARDANEYVNNVLRAHPIFDGWVLELRWKSASARQLARGRSPTEEEVARAKRLEEVVELLQRPATVLRPDQVRTVKDFFRDRINEIRTAEREGESEKRFAEALQEVLDYRAWFTYSIWVRARDRAPFEITNAQYGKTSGAEKSLAIFIPLLAAADARYRDARPDAPKIVAMDEAFNGVDPANRDAVWRFMDELGMSWIVTSEKLWGVGAALRSCTTYQFKKRDDVAVVYMHLWDGAQKIADRIAAPEPQAEQLSASIEERQTA